MAHNSDSRSRIVAILEEAPFVIHACKKVGVSRAAFYRWMKDNKEFRDAVNKALDRGRDNGVEIGEMGLYKLMRKDNIWAIKHFLAHNSDRYAPKRPQPPSPLANMEERKLILETHNFIKRTRPMPKKDFEEMQAAWRRAGLLNDDNQFTEQYWTHFHPIFESVQEDMKKRKDLDVEW